jgi:hypothetical protein
MIHKTITLKFVVPTALVLALGISIGAVFESSMVSFNPLRMDQ